MAGGEVVVERFNSQVLKGNPLGDPTQRDVTIYLPPKYDPKKRYPAAYGIVGYTGTGRMLFGVDPLGEDLKTKLDRLIRTGKMEPMIVPMVDCFTRVGGNQYINSTATGRYDDYLRKELIPFVESKYRVSRRGIWGKSSGGYGSIVHGLLHPDTWSALADHSGDALFEFCYIMDFPKALEAFREHGGPAKWLNWYWRQPNRRKEEMYPVMNTIGVAARGLGEVAALGSCKHSRPLRRALTTRTVRLHRLRDQGPVQSDLGRASAAQETPRQTNQTRVRRIR